MRAYGDLKRRARLGTARGPQRPLWSTTSSHSAGQRKSEKGLRLKSHSGVTALHTGEPLFGHHTTPRRLLDAIALFASMTEDEKEALRSGRAKSWLGRCRAENYL
jgi:hypothetical protein